MQPAENIIAKFGGQSALGRLVGKGQSTVQHWAKTGQVPAKWQSKLLHLARGHGIDLSPTDFVGGSLHAHTVQFYDDDSFLIERVASFIGSALDSGNTAIMVATKSHRRKLAECLQRRGFDVAGLLCEGRYVTLDAAETLAKFMLDDRPDRASFQKTLVDIVKRANRAAKCDRPCAAVFGEMVALLWKKGNRNAAIELEQLWNQLSQTHNFSLMCAYPLKGFSRERHARAFMEVCAEHVDVIPSESYSALSGEVERRRGIARLQQRAQALEAEVHWNEHKMMLMQTIAGMGSWEMDLSDDSILLSKHAQDMLGLHAPYPILLPEFVQKLHLSDRQNFMAALRRSRTGSKEFNVRFRIKPNGHVRVLSAYGKTFYNSGQPLILGLLKELAART